MQYRKQVMMPYKGINRIMIHDCECISKLICVLMQNKASTNVFYYRNKRKSTIWT